MDNKLSVALKYFKLCIKRKHAEIAKAINASSLDFRGIIEAEISCEIARRYIKRLKAEMNY